MSFFAFSEVPYAAMHICMFLALLKNVPDHRSMMLAHSSELK